MESSKFLALRNDILVLVLGQVSFAADAAASRVCDAAWRNFVCDGTIEAVIFDLPYLHYEFRIKGTGVQDFETWCNAVRHPRLFDFCADLFHEGWRSFSGDYWA